MCLKWWIKLWVSRLELATPLECPSIGDLRVVMPWKCRGYWLPRYRSGRAEPCRRIYRSPRNLSGRDHDGKAGPQAVAVRRKSHGQGRAVVDALGTLMFQELNIEHGRIVQGNFTTYPMIGMADAPTTIEIHFLKTDYPVTGLGEPAFPPLAPAVCNAIFAATGTRVRQFPLSGVDLSWS